MRCRFLVVGFLLVVLAAVASAPAATAGQAGESRPDGWTAPRTPWGDPDLQGQWNSQTSTPLERPRDGRLSETDELPAEEAEAIEAANRAAFDLPPPEGSVGNYNAFWRDVGRALTRTSLIVDPPDGRIPPLSEEGAARIARERAERSQRGPATSPDTYSDLSPWTRCISRGWNGIGSWYSSNYQIFQSPGYVVVLQELIHSMKPESSRSTGARTCRRRCGSGWATRAGAGRATRWSSRRRTSTPRPTSGGRATRSTPDGTLHARRRRSPRSWWRAAPKRPERPTSSRSHRLVAPGPTQRRRRAGRPVGARASGPPGLADPTGGQRRPARRRGRSSRRATCPARVARDPPLAQQRSGLGELLGVDVGAISSTGLGPREAIEAHLFGRAMDSTLPRTSKARPASSRRPGAGTRA